MSTYFVVSYNPGATWAAHNKIAEVFNKASRVESWDAPHRGAFLVKSPDGTISSDIRDLITSSSNIDCFVTKADLASYSFSLPRERANNTSNWLKSIHRVK